MPTESSYRYLTRIAGLRGGNTIVAGTRIGVHDVLGLLVNGASVDDVVRSFPELTRAQVYECLAYYEDQGAIHTERAWAHRLPMALSFLFPPPSVLDVCRETKPGKAAPEEPIW